MRASFLVALVVVTASCTSTFGATLPPGSATGSFLDEAEGGAPLGERAQARQQAIDAATRARVDANIDTFFQLRADAIELREALRAGARDLVAEDSHDNIGPEQVQRIRDITQAYLELDTLLYALWTTYREHLPHRSEPDPYAPMRAATLLSASTREAGGLLALAAELERLDNAAVVIETLGPHHALTRFLNRGDSQLELPPESFDRVVGALYDPDHRALISRQLESVRASRERLETRAESDSRLGFLLNAVYQSKSAASILGEGDGYRRVVFLWNVAARSSLDAIGPVIDVFIAAGYIDDPNGDGKPYNPDDVRRSKEVPRVEDARHE